MQAPDAPQRSRIGVALRGGRRAHRQFRSTKRGVFDTWFTSLSHVKQEEESVAAQ
jgi:hypothetical protein